MAAPVVRFTRAQYAAFATQTQRRFCERMLAYLGTYYPQALASSTRAEAEAWMQAALTAGDRCGLHREKHAAQFILLLTVLGVDCVEEPWAGAILKDATLAPLDKLRGFITAARRRGVSGLDEVLVYDGLEEPFDG